MNSADYAKESEKDQRYPQTNHWKALTPSVSFALKISLKTEEKKFSTPWLCVRSDLKRNIPIGHTSLLLVAASIIQAT